MNPRFDKESGAALAAVLIMVAVMSALAIVVVQSARISLQRTANQAQMVQAQAYLLGAESVAVSRITQMTSGDLRIDQSAWQGRDIVFPLDEGMLTIQLRDGSNCFNLNSMVEQQEDSSYITSARGLVQFARLLDLVDVRAPPGLGVMLADWVDSDTQPGPGGAEDASYTGETNYRPPNSLLGDFSELRRVRGFNDEIMEGLAPFACVRPSAAPSEVNVNTIREEQAPVLSMLFGGDLPVSAARDVIRGRPHGGWESIDAFLAAPRLSGMVFPEGLREQLTTRTTYYVMRAEVARGGVTETTTALIAADGARPRVVRRMLGAGAAEYVL